jgi:hypothetical protein
MGALQGCTVTEDAAWGLAVGAIGDGVTFASRVAAYGAAATAGTRTQVTATAFTPPTTTGQRSIKSTNAADVYSTGAGAWSVQLNYLNSSFQQQSEVVQLNGTTAVNTVGTDILYIESMVVQQAGADGANVGTIQLMTGINGGGTVIGGINSSDNQTFWGHHYVNGTQTCYLLSINGGATLASGYSYLVAQTLGSANTVGQQVSIPVVHLAGLSNDYDIQVPVAIAGPALITVWECPTTSNASNVAFSGFEYVQG